MDYVTFILPAFNEEESIASVIKEVPAESLESLGLGTEILVVDDGSRDATAEEAGSRGAKVVSHRANEGKGTAIKTGFANIHPRSKYVVMIDADGTYSAGEALRLLEPLMSGFSDVVIGSRLGGTMTKGSMSHLNRAGNWAFTFLIREIYKANITDSCSGYVAWKREVATELSQYNKSKGFSIEAEMLIKARKLGYEICSVPVTYRKRNGKESKLNPFRDGIRIGWEIFRNVTWKPGKGEWDPKKTE